MNEFLVKNPIFSTAEVRCFLSARGTTGSRSAEAWLAYYQKNGYIVRIKQGLYATVPQNADPNTFTPDAFLLASRMSSDAVLVYHTALEFHGRAYSVHRRLTYQTASPPRALSFRDWQFQPVRVPSPLQRKGKVDFGVIKVNDLSIIRFKLFIDRHNWNAILNRLRNDQAIKWIFVVQR